MNRGGIVLLAVGLASACSARPDLDALDAQVGDGRAVWTFNRGTACDFREHEAICVSGIDEGRHVDVTATIVDAVSNTLPGFQNVCEGRDARIRVEYQGSYSLCTHCPAPFMSKRVGIAFVRLESNNQSRADADWVDTRGGSAEQAALRFGRELADFLAGLESVQCGRAGKS
jgi:hypothetical protein